MQCCAVASLSITEPLPYIATQSYAIATPQNAKLSPYNAMFRLTLLCHRNALHRFATALHYTTMPRLCFALLRISFSLYGNGPLSHCVAPPYHCQALACNAATFLLKSYAMYRYAAPRVAKHNRATAVLRKAVPLQNRAELYRAIAPQCCAIATLFSFWFFLFQWIGLISHIQIDRPHCFATGPAPARLHSLTIQ